MGHALQHNTAYNEQVLPGQQGEAVLTSHCLLLSATPTDDEFLHEGTGLQYTRTKVSLLHLLCSSDVYSGDP